MIRSNVSPARGLLYAACAFAALSAPAIVFAQAEPTRIETVVVSAMRTPQDPASVPSALTMIPLAELKLSQMTSIGDVLNTTPGVSMVSYGAVGSQSALYVRGSNSTQSLIVVDGVRMSSRQSDGYLRSVMGNTGIAGFDRIELLRGPQGTLYGSSAMGGVLVMETTHGCGPMTGSLAMETGSFSTWNLGAAVSGGTAKIGYSAALGWDRTDNWTTYNENRSLNFSTRLEGKLTENLLLGTTIRGQESRYNSPDSRYSTWPSMGKVDSSNYLSTVYAEYSVENLRSRLTYGWHQVSYDYSDSYSLSRYLNTRNVLDWQNAWTPVKELVVVAGVNGEWAHFNNTTLAGNLSSDSTGLYLNANYSPVRDLNIQAGGRYDDFEAIGDKTTGRAGVAYVLRSTGTKFRSTAGTAFAVPGMTERFGDRKWYLANDSIRPESSKGWDFGIDQTFLGGRVTLENTFFKHTFHDMIAAGYVASESKYRYQNISRAFTQGFENALLFRFSDGLRLRTSYTSTQVVDQDTHAPVLYKPRHMGSADLQWTATKGLVLGAGMRFVADRYAARYKADYSKEVFLTEDFTTVRAYASYELHSKLLLKLRVENVLDERYDDMYGYKGSPVAVYAGVEYRF